MRNFAIYLAAALSVALGLTFAAINQDLAHRVQQARSTALRTESVPPVPGGLPVTITLQNHTAQSSARIKRVVLAVVNGPLHHFWHTPLVRFGPNGAYTLRLVYRPGNADRGCNCVGYHTVTTGPLAVVFTRGQAQGDVTTAVTHEVEETMVNPTTLDVFSGSTHPHEIADPVADVFYAYAGEFVSDFVTPAWWNGGPGPYDAAHSVSRARDLSEGYLG